MEALVRPTEVAEYLNVKPGTLRVWAHRNVGPPYVLVQGRRMYRWSQVNAWLDERTVKPA